MAKEQRNECEVGWHGEEVPGHSVLIHPTVTLAIHLDQALLQQKKSGEFSGVHSSLPAENRMRAFPCLQMSPDPQRSCRAMISAVCRGRNLGAHKMSLSNLAHDDPIHIMVPLNEQGS
jgi:hypothetical protein